MKPKIVETIRYEVKIVKSHFMLKRFKSENSIEGLVGLPSSLTTTPFSTLSYSLPPNHLLTMNDGNKKALGLKKLKPGILLEVLKGWFSLGVRFVL